MSIQSIIAFVEENSNKKVASIQDELLAMLSSLKLTNSSETGKNFLIKDGKVVAIYCYYHKKWESVAHIEYGKKASTAHGLNTMCKEGTSMWTKQQRNATKAKDELLAAIVSGKVPSDAIGEIQTSIEEDRKAIVPHENQEYSFNTLEELLAAIN